ncbi:MAG: amidohydrolase family protein, partial [Thermoanaerobaculia bacterium]
MSMHRRRFGLGLAFLFFALPAFAAPGAKPEAATVIRVGTLIDGVSSAPRRDQVIVIRGNRIESVGDAPTVKIPPGARVVDLSRATVLPGLIDAHTHIFL